MSGKRNSTSDQKIDDLRIQSSVYGIPIPLLFGVNRIPGNVIWYGGFKATPHTSTSQAGGKGGGTKTQSTSYSYSASVMMGLCHGNITGIPRIWRGKELFSGGILPGTITTVTEAYAIPGSGAMAFTCAHAADFKAAVSVDYTYTVPATASGDNESPGYLQNVTLSQGGDYSVTAGVFTFVSDALRGVTVQVTYQYVPAGYAQGALMGLGLSFVPGGVGQASWAPLAALAAAQVPAQVAIGYSGFAYVAGQDYDLGTGAQVENHTFEVQGPMAYTVSATQPDPDPSLVLYEILTNARGGAGFPPDRLSGDSAWSDYCVSAGLLMSPVIIDQVTALELVARFAELTNTAPVWSSGKLKMIPFGDTAQTGNGRTFTPNVTPIFDLNDDHIVGGQDDLKVTRKAGADAYNHIRVKFNNSANQYNAEIAEAKDQTDIDASGIRSKDILEAPWITSYSVARQVAQLLLQRSLYVRCAYAFRLPANFVELEAMDLVTLTDPSQGLNLTAVRLTKVKEVGDDDGNIDFEAEDFPAGIAHASLYPSQPGSGFAADYNVTPGSVSAPVIFEAPGVLTANGLEIYVAASGAGAGWGGAHLWVSLDGSNYKQVGTLNGASRYGTVTADAAGTLGVAITAGTLLGGSATDAAKLSTLCYVAGATKEFLAFTTASLTAALAYNLGGLTRGAYGTSSASHSGGDKFVRVDQGVAKSGPLDLGLIGQTVYVKLTSFNVYGGAEESLAAVTAYAYTITGAQVMGNAGASAQAGIVSAASDNVLSAGEKPPVILDYTRATAEQAGIDAQATAYGITTEKTAYDNAVAALTAYLAGLTSPTLWSNVAGDTNIAGPAFRSTWAAMYAARQALLTRFDAASKTLADAAKVVADAATVALIAIGSDNVLSKGEKPGAYLAWSEISGSQSSLGAQAATYGITTEKATLDTAFTTLTNYLNGLLPGWTDYSQDTPITGATFSSYFNSAYSARSALIAKLAAVSGTMATWAGVGGRPSNLAALGGSEGIQNALVNITSLGVLTGAGGGQVTTLPTIDSGNGAFFGARNNNDNPSQYAVGHVKQFKQASSIGISGGTTYCTLETIKQYPDSSGGGVYQYAYQGTATWRRYAADPAGSTWGAWTQDLDRNAYTGDLNATVGATWGLPGSGGNLTGQPSDAALLNAQQTWAQVNAKPADTDLLNSHQQGAVTVINHPAGGNAAFNAPGVVGALKIRLPQGWSNTMLRFFVEVYEYSTDKSFTLEVGGYNYQAGAWYNAYAKMVGSAAAEKTIRFGYDGTYCAVWIGEPGSVWEYPQVIVTGVRAGYSNYAVATWQSGWQVTLDTSAISGHGINYTQSSPLTGASWTQIPGGTGKAADYATQNQSDTTTNNGIASAGTTSWWSGVSNNDGNRPAPNATVGATWGSNLSGQPSDAALLNSQQTWAQVGSRPSNIDAASANPTISLLNSQVTLNSNGTLGGAGGGQITSLPTVDMGGAAGVFGARDRNDPPSEYPVGTSKQFKIAPYLGITGGTYYCTLETIKQYGDNSGGGVYQYAYQGTVTYRRYAANPTSASAAGWGAWTQDLDRNVYTGDLNATVNQSDATTNGAISAAQAAAIAAAAADATTKANAAVSTADAAAQTKANLARTQANAYADGIVTPAEARAIAAAQVKADAAQAAAISAAAADATAKANLAATTANWSGVSGTGRPADNASSDIRLAVRGSLTLSGNSVSGGTGSWNSDCYSLDGFAGGAYCSFVVPGTSYFMAGLNADPTANSSYDSLDYAWHIPNNNDLYIYESSTNPWFLAGGHTAGNTYAVTYDGTSVRYLRNGVVMRTVAVVITGPLFFDSSIVNTGLSNIRFGPMSSNAWAAIGGTGKPENYATVGATFGTNINGQITAATASTYIAALAVDTIQIAGNAVTVPGYAERSTDLLLFSGSGETTALSVTMNTQGFPVYVNYVLVVDGSYNPGIAVAVNVTAKVYIAGVLKATHVNIFNSSASNPVVQPGTVYAASPGAGSFAVVVTLTVTQSGGSLGTGSLNAATVSSPGTNLFTLGTKK
jgi:hypothetical protein